MLRPRHRLLWPIGVVGWAHARLGGGGGVLVLRRDHGGPQLVEVRRAFECEDSGAPLGDKLKIAGVRGDREHVVSRWGDEVGGVEEEKGAKNALTEARDRAIAGDGLEPYVRRGLGGRKGSEFWRSEQGIGGEWNWGRRCRWARQGS